MTSSREFAVLPSRCSTAHGSFLLRKSNDPQWMNRSPRCEALDATYICTERGRGVDGLRLNSSCVGTGSWLSDEDAYPSHKGPGFAVTWEITAAA